MELPKPEGKYGYTSKQIDLICKERGIKRKKFNDAFGVNTAAIDSNTGKVNYYTCDIERALYILGFKEGKNHTWD